MFYVVLTNYTNEIPSYAITNEMNPWFKPFVSNILNSPCLQTQDGPKQVNYGQKRS